MPSTKSITKLIAKRYLPSTKPTKKLIAKRYLPSKKSVTKLIAKRHLPSSKAYREANREKVNASRNAWRKDRYYSDPLFKLTEVYRSAISRGFRSVCLKKDIKSIDCLGCSWEEFQDHIQSQFYDRAETGEKNDF